MNSKQLNEQINHINASDKAFYDEAFKGANIPNDLRRVAERITRSYGIRGICDPMYIANVIAVELKRGDGMSNFKPA